MGALHSAPLKEDKALQLAVPLGLGFTITMAGTDDVDLLASQRLKMWLDIHPEMETLVKGSEKTTRAWVRKNIRDGKLVGFIVRTEKGELAGSGCIWVRPEQPRPNSPRLEVPYLLSMYTERPYRGKGVARMVVKSALKWCRDNDFERVILHASSQGRPLYESLGFEPTNEMRLKLKGGSARPHARQHQHSTGMRPVK